MTRPLPRTEPAPRVGRAALLRVFGNAGLLAFASLAVISMFAGDAAAALLWLGALLVFFAPALDRPVRIARAQPPSPSQRGDGVRWCGLALAAAGAALLFG